MKNPEVISTTVSSDTVAAKIQFTLFELLLSNKI